MRIGGISTYTYNYNQKNTQPQRRSAQYQSLPSFKSRNDYKTNELIEQLEWIISGEEDTPLNSQIREMIDRLKRQQRSSLSYDEFSRSYPQGTPIGEILRDQGIINDSSTEDSFPASDPQPASERKRRGLSWNPFRRKEQASTEVSADTPVETRKQKNLDVMSNYVTELNELYKKGSSLATYKPFEFSAPRANDYGTTEYKRMVGQGMSAQSIFGSLVTRNNDSYDDAILSTIKDPNFDTNYKYSSGYNVSCNPLFILVTMNKPYLLQEALKKRGANPNEICGLSGTLSPLSRAIDSNSLDCVYVLLKSGKISDSEFKRAQSVSKITPEMKKLLNSYPNVEDYIRKTYEAAEIASRKDIKTIDDVLLTPDIDVNFVDSNGNNFLHIINEVNDNEKAMKLLTNALNRKVKINKTNNNGLTPIQAYLKSGKYELVTAMIESGADLSVFKDSLQNGFGHIVCTSADEENAKKLLDYAIEKGLNLDEKNCTGTTIIANAVKTKKYDLLNYLINKGASINIQDDNGMTPLHFACMLNDPKSLEILMNSFPNTQIQDKSGKIASEYLTKPELKQFYDMFKSII